MTVLRKLAPIGSVKKKPTAEQAAAHEAAAAAAAEEEAADSEDELANEGAGGQTVVNTQKLNAKNNQFKQNQQFVPCTEEMFKPIVDFYGIQAPDGRPYSRDQFFGRTETVKSISFLPRTLCDLMEADLSDKRRMKVVHSGLQVFDRNTKTKLSVGCDYRYAALHHGTPPAARSTRHIGYGSQLLDSSGTVRAAAVPCDGDYVLSDRLTK